LVGKGRAADVIYLDSSKAFDTVPHDVLVSKLERLGSDGWVTNRPGGRSQGVVVNDVRVETRDERCSSGAGVGPGLFHVFVSNTDSRIEGTLSEFADDTELSGAVNTLQGRGGIQRDLDRLERWGHASLMRFNKAKGKVLHLGWGNPRYLHRLGVKGWRAALPRGAWGCWGVRSWP